MFDQNVRQIDNPKSPIIERICDTIGEGNKTAPNQMRKHLPGPNPLPKKGVQAMNKPINTEAAGLQKIVSDYLVMSRDQFEQGARNRVHYAKLAREYGMTNQQIADLLGVTEGAVRGLVRRHPGSVIDAPVEDEKAGECVALVQG